LSEKSCISDARNCSRSTGHGSGQELQEERAGEKSVEQLVQPTETTGTTMKTALSRTEAKGRTTGTLISVTATAGRPTEGIGAYTFERISPWSKSGERQWPIFPLNQVTCYKYSSSLKSSKTQCSHSLALSSSDSAASSASTFSLLSRCLASSY